jgi:hypothetical protein
MCLDPEVIGSIDHLKFSRSLRRTMGSVLLTGLGVAIQRRITGAVETNDRRVEMRSNQLLSLR